MNKPSEKSKRRTAVRVCFSRTSLLAASGARVLGGGLLLSQAEAAAIRGSRIGGDFALNFLGILVGGGAPAMDGGGLWRVLP